MNATRSLAAWWRRNLSDAACRGWGPRLAVGTLMIAAFAFRPALADTAAPATRPAASPVPPASLPAQTPTPIRFSTNFPGGMLGKIEAVDPNSFRCFVPGQYNEQGRNRQTSWYYFRLENVRGRSLTLTMTDLIGEYNNRPGAVPHGPDNGPCYSLDGRNWTYFTPAEFTWNADVKEGTIRFTPDVDTVWIAHQPPYTTTDLQRLLDDVVTSPHARIEVIGKTVGGRDIPLVTVTDFAVPDEAKTCVWLQARQHAWEAGTSYVMDGALRFATSDDPQAQALRRKTVFRFTPMVDLDGVAAGKVRFNANGYDVNRNWLAVDLRNPEALKRMPEIWYTKKAITAAHAAGPKIAMLVNLHNTETGEYLQTECTDEGLFAGLAILEQRLVDGPQYEPSRRLAKPNPKAIIQAPGDTTLSLWGTHGVPSALMELRTSTTKKLDRRPVPSDRINFGRELITAMAETASR